MLPKIFCLTIFMLFLRKTFINNYIHIHIYDNTNIFIMARLTMIKCI
jgi:hypothetical protein